MILGAQEGKCFWETSRDWWTWMESLVHLLQYWAEFARIVANINWDDSRMWHCCAELYMLFWGYITANISNIARSCYELICNIYFTLRIVNVCLYITPTTYLNMCLVSASMFFFTYVSWITSILDISILITQLMVLYVNVVESNIVWRPFRK